MTLLEPEQKKRLAADEKISMQPPVSAAESGRRPLHISPALTKILATIAIAAVAIVLALMTWQSYVLSPWTRNGTVRVQVANVAPQVSGQIVRLPIADNQYVRQGDLLYEIDPFNFDVATRTSQALLDQAAANLQVKRAESERRQRLTSDATTPEEQQVFAAQAQEAKSTYDAAVQQLAQAKINLKRTRVTSPVEGYVTNLLLRVGDYAVEGQSNVSVVDSASFWIDGYFEETKLSQICLGDRAEAKLMSYSEPIVGRVQTISRGISVANAASGTQGLPNVDPIYTWVRLAQRIPVRISIDRVPPDVPLISGMTATVTVQPVGSEEHPGWLSRVGAHFSRLSQLLRPPTPRAGCVGSLLQGKATPEFLPVDQEAPEPTSQQLEPGLVPGIDQSPRAD